MSIMVTSRLANYTKITEVKIKYNNLFITYN